VVLARRPPSWGPFLPASGLGRINPPACPSCRNRTREGVAADFVRRRNRSAGPFLVK
jgi:hypothetical protein